MGCGKQILADGRPGVLWKGGGIAGGKRGRRITQEIIDTREKQWKAAIKTKQRIMGRRMAISEANGYKHGGGKKGRNARVWIQRKKKTEGGREEGRRRRSNKIKR